MTPIFITVIDVDDEAHLLNIDEIHSITYRKSRDSFLFYTKEDPGMEHLEAKKWISPGSPDPERYAICDQLDAIRKHHKGDTK